MHNLMLLIAQTTTQPTSQPSTSQSPFSGSMMVFIFVFIGLMIFMNWRTQRKERQKHQEMLGSMKRNDRVVTISGLYGTVVEVNDDSVLLKVDESSNVKMRFRRSAINEVIKGNESK